MVLNSIKYLFKGDFLLLTLELMLPKISTTALSLTQIAKYYLRLLPSLTIVRVLKHYFTELNPYQMI